jgi:multiple sugar transport system permease protein
MAVREGATRLSIGAPTRRYGLASRLGWGAAHVLLVAFGFFMVFPFIWTIGNSLKLPGEIFVWPPTLYPAEPRPANYLDLFRTVPFFTWLRNSVLVTLAATVGAVLSSTLAGYAFASRSAYRR